MPSLAPAKIKEIISLTPDNTVKEAMDMFKIHNIRSLPVVRADGKFMGILGLRHVLLKLLPTSVTMEDGLENLDFVHEATPGITKRLKKLYPMAVTEVMEADANVIDPDTSAWEALRVMAMHGSPVAIVNNETGKFEGLVSRQTLLASLDELIEKS